MRTQLSIGIRLAILIAVVLFGAAGNASAGATIVIINADDPGEGFNDPTPVAPVGGNSGTTRGQQRLIAFQHAANIWGAELDSNQTIYVLAAFTPLGANVLGRAGVWDVFSDFPGAGLHPGAEFPETWYGSALADKRAGADLALGDPDIAAEFSSNFNFYLGLDNNHGQLNDLVTVLLHELGHGLNFLNLVNESNGSNFGDPNDLDRYPFQTDIYARKTLDATTGLYWDQMTQTQRQQSAIRFGRVVWDGPHVTGAVPGVLSFGSPEVRMTAPPAVAGTYQFGTAAFGTPITSLTSPVNGSVIVALDEANAAGPTTTDGCTALTNAAAVTGNIALINRGTCGFVIKAKNAQNAGATAVIIAMIAPGAPIGMAGIDPTVTIPAVSISLGDADAIRANLPVSATIGKDITIRAGADALGRARLFMPNPVQAGSSGSHFDSIAFRNLLMEPAINPDLTHSVKAPEDLSLELLRDIGWFADRDLDGAADDVDQCVSSDLRSTVFIRTTNTGVANPLFTSGCTIADLISQAAAAATNHGGFVSAVAYLTNALRQHGHISNKDKGTLQSTAAQASLP